MIVDNASIHHAHETDNLLHAHANDRVEEFPERTSMEIGSRWWQIVIMCNVIMPMYGVCP